MGGLDLGGGALQQGLLPLKLLPVMVPDDILHVGRRGGSRQGVQVEKALVPLRPGGDGLGRQQGIELLGDEEGVFHHALGGAGVDGHAGDVHLGGGGVEVLVLNGPRRRAVHGVGVFGPEGGHVEVVGPLADLLIGGEGHAQPPVGDTLRHQPLAQGHDLGDPRLVVRAQQGGAVGGNDGFPLEPGQPGEVRRPDHPALLGQDDVAAAVILMDDGVHVLPGKGGGGVQVGQQTQGGDVLQPGGCGQPGGDGAELVDGGVFQPQLLQLVHQQAGQLPLAGGGGGGPRLRGGLGVDPHILQQAFTGSHVSDFLSSLRPTR